MADLKAFAEQLVNLSVKDVNELAKILKDEYGIEPAAAAVAVAAVGGGGADGGGAAEKTSFDVSQQRGKMVQVASLLSFQGGLLVPSYAAAKSGIAGITRALANELAPLGINVNAIAPGYFTTEVTAGIRANPDRNRAILERIPAGRWGEPEDLKGAVVFLASAASDYVHGTLLTVDGGWLAR